MIGRSVPMHIDHVHKERAVTSMNVTARASGNGILYGGISFLLAESAASPAFRPARRARRQVRPARGPRSCQHLPAGPARADLRERGIQ
jgi:acyl-coenzyme A thioesterase PaaI-like protein